MNKKKVIISTLMLAVLIIIGLGASLMFRVRGVSCFVIIVSILGGMKIVELISDFYKWMGDEPALKTTTKSASKKSTASAAAKDNSQF